MMFLAKLGVGVLGTALVGGAALSSEGFIHVKVKEKAPGGTHINLLVPAAAVPMALSLVPRDNLRDASSQLREYMPIIDAAVPALRECPDGVLVEVRDATDHVLITKSGGSLVIDVTDPGDEVHVSVPLRAAQSALHEIASGNGPM
jgi:hypothetical protein